MIRAPACVVWIVVAVAAIVWPAPACAQSAEQQTSTLTHQLMSPYCPGLLLADCRSEGARELRTEILRRVEAGEPTMAIEEDLIARFGTSIRTVPAFSGIGIVVWIGPLVLGLAGLSALVLALRSATRRRDGDLYGESVDGVELSSATGLHQRLQEELEALD